MAANQSAGILSKQVSDKDLDHIAQSIGLNWELLAPYLFDVSAMRIVERIKMEQDTCQKCVFHLLSKWRNKPGPHATLGQLFHEMLQAGFSTTIIDLQTIAGELNIELKAIKACKDGYPHPIRDRSANQKPDAEILSKQVSERDLADIVQSTGLNWEMLAPYLLEENTSRPTISQIKSDHRTTLLRAFYLLFTWKNKTEPDATLGRLFNQMLQAGSTSVEWQAIAGVFNIELKAIIACKECYPPKPLQESSAAQKPNAGKQNVAPQGPIQVSSEIDSGHLANGEKMEVVEDEGQRVKEVVDGNQTDGSPLSKKNRNKRQRPPINACIFDGRLIKLEEDDISILENKYTNPIGEGNFGKVYSASDNSVHEGFGIHIAVKKISLNGSDAHLQAVRREMIASRIMHPFVLPLLAVIEKGNQEVWFVSPLCETGDLSDAIRKGILKESKTRVKILLHVASAIQYIHTEIPGVRDVILHKDISSKNVLLDANFNARLIDFGLAREKEDIKATVPGGIYYSHPNTGDGQGATESYDYFSFGVIIREMLTSLAPEGSEGYFLKNMDSKKVEELYDYKVWEDKDDKKVREIVVQKIKDYKVWEDKDAEKVREIVVQKIKDNKLRKVKDAAKKLNVIAFDCKKKLKMNLKEFEEKVVEGIKDILRSDLNQDRIIDIPDGNTKCHICMINPKATKTSMTPKHDCRLKIEACIACEKNSFLNPIRCYCGTDLKPVIGCRWGALLVAGNDTENSVVAEAMTKDIIMLEKLITSFAPRIMGISKDKVRMVVPVTPGKSEEPLWPQVKEYINDFSKETEVDTLLIYFSCHGTKEVGEGDVNRNNFQLSTVSDSISLAEFEEELEKLGKIDKLIIILDRCYPVMVQFKDRGRKFIQINACASDKKADIGMKGSIFTKYLIQGLKACSEGKMCPDTCQYCENYWSNRSDFISVESLFEYVKNHMIMNKGPEPKRTLAEDRGDIAFYTDEEVVIKFTCEEQEKQEKVVSLEYLQEMKTLEEKLFDVFRKDKNQFKVRIQKDTYRKNDRLLDCDTLEKVMSAWVNRQPLNVVFE